MADAPNPELLRSLGKLARGLSALFWGLPATLLVSTETIEADWLRPLGVLPLIVVNALLLYGLWLISHFQKQERPWRNALDRAKLLALVNLGLCPFLFWYSRMPQQVYFAIVVAVYGLCAFLFLFSLNGVLKQLGAMLPDETLRQETRSFTRLNRWLLLAWLLCSIASFVLPQAVNLPARFDTRMLSLLWHAETAVLLFLGLAPFAITMALVWKAKEVILDSVFGTHR